jgi:hypothetical protein
MNSKDGFSDGTSTYAINRLMYSKKTYEPMVKKTWGASDASETTQRNRTAAIGKTSESSGFTSLSHTNGNLARDALRRVRSGGASVPKKIGTKNLQPPVFIPNPPINLVGTYANSSVTISFTPGDNGGAEIIDYLYSFNGKTFTSLGTNTSPVTITGLTNGTIYTIYLRARNRIGISKISSIPITITTSTIPSAPSSLTATPADGSVSIQFVQTSNGGAAITDYLYSFDDEAYYSSGDNTSPITISDLTNDTEYTIYIKAVNINGNSSASDSITVTPYLPYFSSVLPSLSLANALLQLEGSDSNSYPSEGTIWYDVAPKISSGYRSLLYNGSLVGSNIVHDGESGTFDISNGSYISIPDSAGLRATTTQYRSFCVWMYVRSEQNPGKGIFSKMYASGSFDGYSLAFNSNRSLTLNMNGSSRDNHFYTDSTNVYNLNTWHMYSGVICFGGNTTNPSKVYVDTTLVLTANSQESYISSATASIIVPCGIPYAGSYSDAIIGAIYYFDNKLTDEDVSSIYDATKTTYGL